MSLYVKREICLLVFAILFSFAYAYNEYGGDYDDDYDDIPAPVYESFVDAQSRARLKSRGNPRYYSNDGQMAKITIKKYTADDFDDSGVPEWNGTGNDADPSSTGGFPDFPVGNIQPNNGDPSSTGGSPNMPDDDFVKKAKAFYDAVEVIKKLKPFMDSALDPDGTTFRQNGPGNTGNQMPNSNGAPSSIANPMTQVYNPPHDNNPPQGPHGHNYPNSNPNSMPNNFAPPGGFSSWPPNQPPHGPWSWQVPHPLQVPNTLPMPNGFPAGNFNSWPPGVSPPYTPNPWPAGLPRKPDIHSWTYDFLGNDDDHSNPSSAANPGGPPKVKKITYTKISGSGKENNSEKFRQTSDDSSEEKKKDGGKLNSSNRKKKAQGRSRTRKRGSGQPSYPGLFSLDRMGMIFGKR